MRRLLSVAFLALLFAPLASSFGSAQDKQDSGDRAAEILKKIDLVIQHQSERTRAEILELIREELRGTRKEAAPQARNLPAASTEKAKAVVTTELLKKHASYLASDELEGRCAGYPGCDKAADYIAEVFRKSGL